MKKYTLKDLLTNFATNAQCLEFIKEQRWLDGIPCAICGKVTQHHLIVDRKCYSCQDCGTRLLS
jgi:transposase